MAGSSCPPLSPEGLSTDVTGLVVFSPGGVGGLIHSLMAIPAAAPRIAMEATTASRTFPFPESQKWCIRTEKPGFSSSPAKGSPMGLSENASGFLLSVFPATRFPL